MRTPVSPQALAAALGQFPPTAEQSAVIAAPLAPALVVAGAGSGKTETMAGPYWSSQPMRWPSPCVKRC